MQNSTLSDVSRETWLLQFAVSWQQGEHIAIIGPTGTGKTTIAQLLLEIRDFCCVLAIKRIDETLERFKNGPKFGMSRYTIIQKWPPEYNQHRVVFWKKPKSLAPAELKRQSAVMGSALNQMYLSGGWCIFFDDTGYIVSQLGLAHELATMLSQGRSAGISVVVAMVRPRSMVARVPKEALNQCSHVIVFQFTDLQEVSACADIVGISKGDMIQLIRTLDRHEFLAFSQGKVVKVRNELPLEGKE